MLKLKKLCIKILLINEDELNIFKISDPMIPYSGKNHNQTQ